ncbi:latrophilin-like protein LAT-2 [Patiria miniata]|uniref:Adhesion G-protein coupled receptor D1-like n=1 Tax=Patiria miniata TaxID=46514 RepID=A0A914B8C1_PATMI|nr:latrophilin-like protein LAT-2 [Patiria miniata]
MWQWMIFLTVPVFAALPEYEDLYHRISSEELYDSAFAYWSLDFLEENATAGSISGAGFCSITGIDVLNGGVVLKQPEMANRKSAKITLSSYPNECPTDPRACAEGFTVAFWLSLKEADNQTLTDETCMLLSLNDTSNMGFQIQFGGSSGIVSFRTLGSTIESEEVYNATKLWMWNHMGLTWNNRTGNLTVFSNGHESQTLAVSLMGDGNDFDPGDAGCPYVALDEIGIWDRPLNESEMKALRLDPFNWTDPHATTPAGWTSPVPTTTADLSSTRPTTSADLSSTGPTTSADLSSTGPTTTADLSSTGPTTSADLSSTGPTTTADLSSTGPTTSADLSSPGPTTRTTDYSTESSPRIEEATVDEITPESTTTKVPTEAAGSETMVGEDPEIRSTPPATTAETAFTSTQELDPSTAGLEATSKPESSTATHKTTQDPPPGEMRTTGKFDTTADDLTTDGAEITKQPSDTTLRDAKLQISQSDNIDDVISNLTYVTDYLSDHEDNPDKIDAEVLREILMVPGDKVRELVEGAEPEKRKSLLEVYMGIVNQILQINKKDTEKSFISGVTLGKAVDHMLAAYIRTGADSEIPQLVNNTFVDSKLAVIEPNQETITVELGTSDAGTDAKHVVVIIPRSIFKSGQTGRVSVTSYYQGVQKHLPDQLQGKSLTYTVHSLLVGINVNANSTTNFKDDVAITFTHSEVEKDKEATCAFLKDTSWSSEGCTTTSAGTTSTKCECDHLTSFAVLVSPRTIEISAADSIALEILTNLGLAVSIICLLISLIILNVLRQLTSTRISILKHTAAALLVAQSLFILGGTVGKLPTFCKVVAALSHYFFLAVFCWVLIQGVHLYMKVRRALKGGIDMIYFYVFGWGFPLIVVGISFGIEHMNYGVDQICWISVKQGAGVLIAFIGPAYFVLAINLVVICMVMHVFMTVKVNKDKSEKDKIKSGLKAVIVMVPILGLSWLFGVLIITSPEVVFHYLFVIFNCSQGVFIFLFHVVFNDEVKQALNKKRNKIAASKDSNTLFSKVLKTSKTTGDHSTSTNTTTSVN